MTTLLCVSKSWSVVKSIIDYNTFLLPRCITVSFSSTRDSEKYHSSGRIKVEKSQRLLISVVMASANLCQPFNLSDGTEVCDPGVARLIDVISFIIYFLDIVHIIIFSR